MGTFSDLNINTVDVIQIALGFLEIEVEIHKNPLKYYISGQAANIALCC